MYSVIFSLHHILYIKCAKSCTYFLCKFAILLALKYLYVNRSCLFQIFHANEKFEEYALGMSGLGLVILMRLHGKKDTQFAKSLGSILHSELKAHILPPLEGNNKGRNTHTRACAHANHLVQDISTLK